MLRGRDIYFADVTLRFCRLVYVHPGNLAWSDYTRTKLTVFVYDPRIVDREA